LITVGGGLAGAALGRAMAGAGARVLVLEREQVFRDRVRGELVHPWGVAEARLLGLYDLLKQTCAYEVRLRSTRLAGTPLVQRDLVETTPHRAGSLHFAHPDMQQVLLDDCARAGATVQRGVRVADVVPGPNPMVYTYTSQGERAYHARLIVGADGRASLCRKWAALPAQRDPDRMVIAGVLFAGLSAPEDAIHIFINPAHNEVAFLLPLGKKRFRCYSAFYQQPGRRRLSGPEAVPHFIDACVSAGAEREWFEDAQVAGPLASFDGAETWVPHPYRSGVALVGDAAATSDPTFGCGLSLTMRDVRTLSHLLSREPDWDAAAHAYAEEHDRYFEKLHRVLDWLVLLYYKPGADAETLRQRALSRVDEDPSRMPDIPGLGPEAPSDEAAFHNLFGEA
ncbi:MAG: NAD(P)/FAD-dependent oxidoreductase, partial [Anaerolineae bacterium]